MKLGDLVKLDNPGYSHHRMMGIIVEIDYGWKNGKIDYGWKKRYSYHVLVGGKVSRFSYEELLAEEDWGDEGGRSGQAE